MSDLTLFQRLQSVILNQTDHHMTVVQSSDSSKVWGIIGKTKIRLEHGSFTTPFSLPTEVREIIKELNDF